MPRRTKIIATIGPASESEAGLASLIDAGMDIARINLSHGTLEHGLERFHRVRKVSALRRRSVGILVDLPGPKIRVGQIPEEGIVMVEGSRLSLEPGNDRSSAGVIQVDHESLLEDVRDGDLLTFGDGAVQVRALGITGNRVEIEVVHGGRLTGRPGIHIPSDRTRLLTPTPEDLRILAAFVEVGVDMVALSFVRSADDLRRLELEPSLGGAISLEPNPSGPLIVAKIETRAAVENLDEIVKASGAVMVARGDLGAEFPISELPHLQKQIIRRCIAVGRPVITATQMLESMIHAPSPTRAEASDVANAVFDGTSAVMLSGETAVGRDPANVVSVMSDIAERADAAFDYDAWPEWLAAMNLQPNISQEASITNAITSAAQRAANEIGAAAILCISSSGFSVRSIARFRPRAKIIGFSSNQRTINQLTMSWGTTPYLLDTVVGDEANIAKRAIESAKAHGEIVAGDLVVFAGGSSFYDGRVTDNVRIIRVP
ncbi:MAG: pyruvate kinase [Actinobacteria bacterium]|uniref:pyruvate kinase n=1 Tax=freshwater metagenome TaxID=449393 RepID=A0A6J5YEE4_9ZZZZ|nr:pyruvate kinase [Actinomycetota bacterium]